MAGSRADGEEGWQSWIGFDQIDRADWDEEEKTIQNTENKTKICKKGLHSIERGGGGLLS